MMFIILIVCLIFAYEVMRYILEFLENKRDKDLEIIKEKSRLESRNIGKKEMTKKRKYRRQK